jgi:hypothetical protein
VKSGDDCPARSLRLGFAALNPGYEKVRKNGRIQRRQNADRRCSLNRFAFRQSARLAKRARLSAFHCGSGLGTHASRSAASDQASRSKRRKWRGFPAGAGSGYSEAPRVPVIMPAGMMSEPPECRSDETSARGHRPRSRQPESPADILFTRSGRPALLFPARAESSRIICARFHLIQRHFFSAFLMNRSARRIGASRKS